MVRRLVSKGSTGVAIEWSALIAWAVGVAVYQLAVYVYPEWGSALPSLILSFAVAKLWPQRTA